MEFADYLVSYSCYPRCQHAYKYLKHFSDRYDDLQKARNTCRNNKSEFHLYLQTSDLKGQCLDMKNVLKRNEEYQSLEIITCENIKDLIHRKGHSKEMYFVLIINDNVSKDDIPEFDNVQLIRIADDEKDRDKAIELYKDTQNMHISMKEHLSDQVSNIIERCLFKTFGMKGKCEQLLKTMNSRHKVESRQEKSKLFSNEESCSQFESKNSNQQRRKSEDDIIQRDSNQQRRKSEEYIIQRDSNQQRRMSEDDIIQRDKALAKPSITRPSISFQDLFLTVPEMYVRFIKKDLLGRSTLTDKMSSQLEEITKKRNKGKRRNGSKEIRKKSRNEYVEKTERLYDEIIGMFSRSRVPKFERPQLDKPFDGIITDKLKQDLRRISPYIRSCGYRCRSFVVFVDENYNSELLKPDLETIMKKHDISTFTIVPSSVKQFSSCNVGSMIAAEFDKDTTRFGTLGGFGLASSDKESKTGCLSLASSDKGSETIGLVSRHVVTVGNIAASILRCGSGEQPIEASVLVDNSFSDRENVLDIAAASFGHNKEGLDTRYRTSEERAVPGRLSDYKPEEMQGLHVHIRGSATSMGYGTVTMPKIEAIRDKDMDGNYIIIEDRENPGTENKAFCKEGDSGAIVCADDQENPEEVQLISMVMGENTKKPGSYYSLNLKNGIQQVEEETKSNIKLL